MLRGNEAEVGHQPARRTEAADIVDLGQEGQRGKRLDPAQAHEGLDAGPERFGTCREFEVGIEGSQLGLQVFQVLQVDRECRLERPLEGSTK